MSIDTLGEVTVRFNQTMETEGFNLSRINSTVLDLKIEANSFDSEVPKNLNFSWNVTEFKGKFLTL